MSTIKSSAENLTLNADGANNDVIIQSNGSTKVTVDGATGNVGVGTTTPDSVVHMHDTGTAFLTMTTDTSGQEATDGLVIGLQGDSNVLIYNRENAALRLGTNNLERLQIEAAGDLNIKAGDLYFGTAGKGIVLGATTNVDANTLDDYEEGTWTAGITGATFNFSSGNTTGYYTKIGRQVFFQWYSAYVTISSASGIAVITGLPFASSNASQNYGVFNYQHGDAVDGGSTGGYININDNRMQFVDTTSISAATFIDGAGKYIMISGSYFVA